MKMQQTNERVECPECHQTESFTAINTAFEKIHTMVMECNKCNYKWALSDGVVIRK